MAAIEEGRGIYSNIRKAIHYLLPVTSASFTIFTVTLLTFGHHALAPRAALWLTWSSRLSRPGAGRGAGEPGVMGPAAPGRTGRAV